MDLNGQHWESTFKETQGSTCQRKNPEYIYMQLSRKRPETTKKRPKQVLQYKSFGVVKWKLLLYTKQNPTNLITQIYFSNNLIKYYILERMGMECEMTVVMSPLELLLSFNWNMFGLVQFCSPTCRFIGMY